MIAFGNVAYAGLRGQVPAQQILWTGSVDAAGFLLLAVGLSVGLVGVAFRLPRGIPEAPPGLMR